MADTGARHPLRISLLLISCVWSVLFASQLASPVLGAEGAVLLGFVLATALVVASRGRGARRAPRWSAALGLAAGYCSFNAWVAVISLVGLGIGLDARTSWPEPGPALTLASLLCAPVFEEILYRERLLPPLRDRLGAPLAVALGSLLFALPHLESWSILGAFLVGLLLGSVYLAGGSVGLCIGLHAGLNLAALVVGLEPGARLALPVVPSLVLGTGILLAALARIRAVAVSSPRRATSAARPRAGR